MTYAVSWSGGKDCALALDRALAAGLDVRWLLNLHEAVSGRVRFHGVPGELVAAQAEALGLRLLQTATGPDDFEPAFLRALDELAAHGVGGLVFGNIHLADVRGWYETRVRGRGLDYLDPLWGEEPGRLVDEVVARGWRPLVASVNLELGRTEWLGRELDAALAAELRAAPGVDPAGERGEYHTFVLDGPLFRRPVRVARGGTFEAEGHLILDLAPAG